MQVPTLNDVLPCTLVVPRGNNPEKIASMRAMVLEVLEVPTEEP